MENAVDETPAVEAVPKTVGELLKSAREQLGLTLSSVAAKTRVPMRHLESIEQSQFGALPGQTYTIGFVRSYARAVDLDEIATVNALRAELSRSGHQGYQAPLQNYEPADPARVPSKTLAWTAAAIAAVVLAAYSGIQKRDLNAGCNCASVGRAANRGSAEACGHQPQRRCGFDRDRKCVG